MSAFDTTPLTATDVSRAVQRGQVIALFQPIEALQTGICRGFEALARLPYQDGVLLPDQFLSHLDADDRLCLFGTMLGQAIAFLETQQRAGHDFYVSLNVEISLIMSEDFVDILQYFLERYDFSGERLVLEILENEDVAEFARLRERVDTIRAFGITIALDDVGTGYSSLQKIMHLPIDIFKLDRAFCRDIESKPEDLLFVMSVLTLARALCKRMVVEGIETPEMYDALRILGVDYGQGYAIARPMPPDAVAGWLAGRTSREPDRVPQCLLGAYASHLTVVESCRAIKQQPLQMRWAQDASDHRGCAVGQLFGLRGWHDTAFGQAHAAFHAALPTFDLEETVYERAVERFRKEIGRALIERPAAFRCDPASSAARTSSGTIREARPRPARMRRRGAALAG